MKEIPVKAFFNNKPTFAEFLGKTGPPINQLDMIYLSRVKNISIILLVLLSSKLVAKPSNFTLSQKDEVIVLSGTWQFVPNTFLSYDDAANLESGLDIAVPGTWNDLLWEDQPFGAVGYGTYVLKVKIDEALANEDLALEIPEVSLAYRVFVNDLLVGQVGVPATHKETTVPRMKMGLYTIHSNDISGEELLLIFHVSNFHHESGGLWYAPKLGTWSRVTQDHNLYKTFKLLMIGSTLILGIFQLYIFFLRRKEKLSLIFFAACLTLALQSLTRGDLPIMELFPSMSWVWVKRLLYISIYFLIPVNGLFLHQIFPKFFHKKFIHFFSLVALVAAVFTLITPPRISYSLIVPAQLLSIALGVYLFYSLFRAVSSERFGAKYLLFGYLGFASTALHDILRSNLVIDGFPFPLIHIGTGIYLFLLIGVLAYRHIFTLESNTKLSRNLQKVNRELEQIVEQRTKKLREQNEVIEIQNRKLQKALEDKDDLMAILAHDLKAPLSNIEALTKILKVTNDQDARLIQLLKQSTKDGSQLIEEVIAQQLYEGDFKLNKKEFDLQKLINEKRDAYLPEAAKKNISLKTHFQLNNNTYYSDSLVISRILDNLLSNAIKFLQVGGEVYFELIKSEDGLNMRVKDNGPGFTEADKEKLFNKFQKLSARPTGGESSSGLGLSIVRTLVTALDGDIKLESSSGKGADFSISLPA